MPIVLKSGSLNLLEPSGPVQACNGIALPFSTLYVLSIIIIIIFNLSTAAFTAYCAIWVRRSNFRHQASPCVSPHESTQRWKVELWARNVRKFCLNADFHFTFTDLLHAVKVRYGTDGFTSPPKKGVLRIFFFAVKLGVHGAL